MKFSVLTVLYTISFKIVFSDLDSFRNGLRMKKAITSLIEVPQNNFRIFKNGTQVYGQNSSTDIYDILKDFFVNNHESYDR